MSARCLKADLRCELPSLPGLAISRLKPLRNSNRTLAHCDAGGGSRPPHHKPTLAFPKEVKQCSLTTGHRMAAKGDAVPSAVGMWY